jgi:gliding motility-associated-like protein
MRLILTFLLLLSFNLRSQTLSFTNCDSTDRVQTFYVELNPGSTYNWSVTGGTIISENLNRITVLFPNTESTFVISVIENNSTGCPGEQRKLLVESLPCKEEVIWIPSAFTPNGDDLNDVFYVMGLIPTERFSFEVYNKWGEKLFTTNDPNVGWDGTYKGSVVQDDVYVYKVFCMVNSRYFAKFGSITLFK